MKKIITLFAFLCISLGFTQVPSYVPSNGLIGWWPFNGNANDESGNGNHGTVNGAALTIDRVGNSNSAYFFSANTDMIGIPTTTINSQNFSISVWCHILTSWTYTTFNLFKIGPNDNSSYGGISLICDQNNVYGNGNYIFGGRISNANTLKQTISPYYNFQYVSNWHHYVFIKDNDNSYLYIDNVLVNTMNGQNIQIDFTNSSLKIGNQANLNSNQCGNRKLDDIGFWNRALTASEVQQLYSGQLSTTETSKSLDVKYYPNPVENILTLSSEETISKVLVHNTAGQLVLVKDFNSKSISIDMSKLSKGNYFVKVEGKSKTNEFKIIKK